jgi:uncharacterized membrane protein
MFPETILYLVLLLFLAVIVPILAIVAFVRVRRLEGSHGTDPQVLQRLFALEQRIKSLESRPAAAPSIPAREAPVVAQVAPPVPSAPLAQAPSVTPQAAPPVASSPSVSRPAGPPLRGGAAPAAVGQGIDLENLIAGRWMNYVGILALLFAVAFFIKYAFDNNWVGPRGRVAIGLLLGTLMIPWSDYLLRRGYKYFSEGIAGLGAATLYLSVWSGLHYYKLFAQSAAFAGMIVITAAMVAVAVGRNSQRIVWLALAGGMLTPLLVRTGKDQQVVLFTYLAVLSAGMLLLARVRNWPALSPLCFLAAQVYFWGWYATFYEPRKLLPTALFATLFFVLFAALPVLRTWREGQIGVMEFLIVLGNALVYLVALRVILWPEHRWTLTLAALALAAAHLLVTRALPPAKSGERDFVRYLFAGLALTFVTLAIPIRMDGKWITMAWAVEGAVLVWSGLRAKTVWLRGVGVFLIVVAAFRLAAFPIHADQLLFNGRFATFAVVVASFACCYYFARSESLELGESEKTVFAVIGVGANVYALWALSLEAWDLFGRMQTLGIDRSLAQQLALSLVWTVYAAALLLAGIRGNSAALRWQGLTLIGLVVVKVFLIDLSSLERFYRIVSFLILGVVLLVISFLYQRRLAASKGEKSG